MKTWSEIVSAAIREADEGAMNNLDPDVLAVDAYLVRPEFEAAMERQLGWDVLMQILDQHYPIDVFPTGPDLSRRDSGPRIISLIRHLDAERVTAEYAADANFRWRPSGTTAPGTGTGAEGATDGRA